MKWMTDRVSGQTKNCKLCVQVRFFAVFFGSKRRDGKQGWELGLLAPSSGHSDSKTGYKCNRLFLRGNGRTVFDFRIPNDQVDRPRKAVTE